MTGRPGLRIVEVPGSGRRGRPALGEFALVPRDLLEAEAKHGQIAVKPEDFEAIPGIVSDPDRVIFGGKTKSGLDSIGYVKRLDDGSIAYVEEKRTGRKKLSAVTMRKYPATLDVDRIADNLQPNVRSDSGRTESIVVHGPNTDKGDILHQSQIPNWFKNLPTPVEGEDHPALVSLRDRAAASGVPLDAEQESAAREAIDAASRGDDAVWQAAQEKYEKLRDEDPRTAELRAAREVYSKAQADVTLFDCDFSRAPHSTTDALRFEHRLRRSVLYPIELLARGGPGLKPQ